MYFFTWENQTGAINIHVWLRWIQDFGGFCYFCIIILKKEQFIVCHTRA